MDTAQPDATFPSAEDGVGWGEEEAGRGAVEGLASSHSRNWNQAHHKASPGTSREGGRGWTGSLGWG